MLLRLRFGEHQSVDAIARLLEETPPRTAELIESALNQAKAAQARARRLADIRKHDQVHTPRRRPRRKPRR